jgi:type I restriction enzyme, R subunit
MPNQNPEQIARDEIDKQLILCGWQIQNKDAVNLSASIGIAVREYQTDIGPADYVLFIDKKPAGIIEAKRAEEAEHFSIHEEQSEGYAAAKLKYLNNEKLPFVYESTGSVTRVTDFRDPKPRARIIFSFHTSEMLFEFLNQEKSLRARLQEIPSLPIECLRDCQVAAITNLEQSFKDNKPRALIQMATGSG